MRQDDQGVATVVGALLILAALVSFLVVYNIEWAPVFVENHEGEASARLSEAIVDWAATAEGHVSNGHENRTFSRSLPIGVSTGLFLRSQRSTGAVSVDPAPVMTVFRNATQVARVEGGLQVDAAYQRYPNQTVRYTFGAIELTQRDGTWVDLRGLVAAERGSGGALTVGVTAVGVSGGPQRQGGGSSVEAVGFVQDAVVTSQTAGTVRFKVDNVQADAWRTAFARVLEGASLTGETSATCSASPLSWCLDSTTNTPSTVDVYLRNVAGGWATVYGTVRVELRT